MTIVCLIGHSSSGKSTLESRLEEMGIPRIISYTTRPMREGEKNGSSYHFILYPTFLEMEQQGKFTETAKYRDWYYGLSLDGIDYQQKDYIAVVTVQGYKELLKAVGKENIVAIHIKVEERERIIRQLQRGDVLDEVIRRIHTDRKDFAEVEEICDYIVENKHLDKSLVEVYNIIRKHSSAK